MRPSFDAYFLGIAKAVSLRGDCTRRQCGAVIVDGFDRIISTGYNGVNPGDPGCLSAGACPRGQLSYEDCPAGSDYSNCIATHAEDNALRFATRSVEGATVYVTSAPCEWCIEKCKKAGVYRISWPGDSLLLLR